jgi:hypothetical protein
MDNLIIEHKGQLITRKIIGGFGIIIAIGFLIFEKNSLGQSDWPRAILFFILGMLFFTPLMGSTKSQIEICDGGLKIIWMNWIRTVTIPEAEIERIILATDGIKIFRKDKKAVKLLLYYLGREQKNKVYEFFTQYAQQKNFVLGR